jgi:hypothetical protein
VATRVDATNTVQRALIQIRCQLRCDTTTAFELLHERATFDRATLTDVARRVLDGRISWSD